ncbi:MAG: ImmA/IrrE family metallo-endopeptidase [bacterium]|nr:ImmA/IrrE family metallo-endopeptidase [bacterium]
MTVRVDVKPSLYKWASERSKLDPDVLARKFPMLREWMAGDRVPTLKQVEKFAQATGTAVGYFFLPEPPDERIPIPDLRTIGNQAVVRPSGNLLDTIYQCQQRQDWYREYARSAGLQELEWIGSLGTSTPPTEAARKITIGLSFSVEHRGTNWTEAFTNLRNRAEEAGVLVMVSGVVGSNNYRKLDPKEFRGFALADTLAPLVFVNGADTRAAQIFTLAHELAHIWLGESALSDADLSIRAADREEAWCNQVAAEMLVPMERIRSDFDPGAERASELQRLARKFKSSTLVVLRRIHEAGYLSWEEYQRSYMAEYERAMESRGSGGGNFYNTQPVRVGRTFAQAVITSTLEGHTSYTDAFQMLGFKKASTFDELADRLGVT